jgi:hypothetical protein
MRVLQQRGWKGLEVTCDDCASVVLVEADDVVWRSYGYAAQCGYCKGRLLLNPDDLTPEVRRCAMERSSSD